MVLPPKLQTADLSFRDCTALERLPLELQQCQELQSFKLFCDGCSALQEVESMVLPPKLQTADLSFRDCTALERLPLELQQCQELQSFKLNCSGCSALKEVKSLALPQELQTLQTLYLNFRGRSALSADAKEALRELKSRFPSGQFFGDFF
eukprot:TRINITY_DN8070_c0_g1_i1.p3 TRINITY_DN8070_c0_g1~~TRINITY_DN8070_c0_g1_i1.p3  ORF type:complete len:172 (+),score=71.52 TRINITY_DN8070_c0_g1_i1:64-516(+)